MPSLANYTMEASSSNDQIIKGLETYGLVILPNYLPSEELASLNQEFDDIIDGSNTKFQKEIKYSIGAGKCVYREKLGDHYPVLRSVFGSTFMEGLKNEYLDKDSSFNSEIYVVKDIIGAKHVANDLHFDVLPTFKYLIYLTNTTAKNGAFSCVPGSHKLTEELRKKHGSNISYDNREITRDLPITEDQVVHIEGTEGTLIIFTTETFHRAGAVSQGDRRVMRGHCRRKQYQSKKSVFKSIKSKLKFFSQI